MSRVALVFVALLVVASIGERQADVASAAGATTHLAWGTSPSNGVATVPSGSSFVIEARDGSNALNAADGTTQVQLSLQAPVEPAGVRSTARVVVSASGVGGTPPTSAQFAALDAFASAAPSSLRADFNPENGTLRRLTGSGGALRGPDPRTPSEIAADFLGSVSGAAGMSRSFVASLEEEKVDTTPSTGLSVVHYAQHASGLPVFEAHARIGIAADGRVVSYNANLFPDAGLPSGPALVDVAGAIAAASAAVGPPGAIPLSGPDMALLASFYTPVVVPVLVPTSEGSMSAWRVSIVQEFASWLVLVNAHNGAVLQVFDFTADVGPEGDVFLDDPVAGPQTTVPFVGDMPSPRDTWIGANFDTNCVSCTAGNNVTAVVAHENIYNTVFATSPTLEFKFPWTNKWAESEDYVTDRLAAVTTLFYVNNVVHDWFYDLGFTEGAGNFQSSNFGGPGYGDDPIFAYSQYGATTCNLTVLNCRNSAFFSFSYDGYRSRMYMFLFDTPERSDTTVDGDTIIHEYSHGLSTRIIGPTSVSGVQSGAMGEGWGDYFATSYYDDPVVFEYSTSNPVSGKRHFSYEGHPWTYSHLCQTTFPTGESPRCEVHADGEIWTAALWDLRKVMVVAHGAGGAAMTDQLVVSGIKLTPANPDMLQARDAILAADLAENAGANKCRIWQAFATRGMGVGATTDGDDDTSVTDSFATHPSCGSAVALTCNEALTQTVTAGIATWTGCTISEPGSGYTIRASSSSPVALAPVDSAAFDQTDRAYDATCNGTLDTQDALALMRHLAGFTTGVLPAGPCTGKTTDDILDIGDPVAIRRRVSGID